VFVPDTNAMLFNPNLDQWVFDGHESLLLVLVPAVLAELDKLKIVSGGASKPASAGRFKTGQCCNDAYTSYR